MYIDIGSIATFIILFYATLFIFHWIENINIDLKEIVENLRCCLLVVGWLFFWWALLFVLLPYFFVGCLWFLIFIQTK